MILAFVGEAGGTRFKVILPSLHSESKGQPGLHLSPVSKKKRGGAEERRIWCLLPKQEDLNWILSTQIKATCWRE